MHQIRRPAGVFILFKSLAHASMAWAFHKTKTRPPAGGRATPGPGITSSFHSSVIPRGGASNASDQTPCGRFYFIQIPRSCRIAWAFHKTKTRPPAGGRAIPGPGITSSFHSSVIPRGGASNASDQTPCGRFYFIQIPRSCKHGLGFS